MAANAVLAIDIGARELRATLFERAGGRWRASRAKAAPLPHGEGREAERHAAIRQALAREYREAGRPAPDVHVALPKGLTLIRTLEAPRVARKELESILALRAPQEIPYFDPAQVAWDFEVLPGMASDTGCRVALSAVRRPALQRFLEDFEAAGVRPDVVDVETLALMRCLLGRRRNSAAVHIAAMDFGENAVSIGMAVNGRISLFGQAPLSGEELRRGDATARARLANELKSAIRSLGNGNDIPAPQEIVFCGDPALYEPMVEPMQPVFGVRPTPWREYVRKDDGFPSIPPAAYQGNDPILESLLWRATLAEKGLTNFLTLPKRGPAVAARAGSMLSLRVLIPATVVLVALFLFGGKQLRTLEGAAAAEGYEAIKPLTSPLDRLEATVNTLDRYEHERVSWMQLLSDMVKFQPKEITFSSMKMTTGGKATLEGVVTGENPAQIVGKLCAELKKSKHFSDAQFSTVKRGERDSTFTITGALPKTAAQVKGGAK